MRTILQPNKNTTFDAVILGDGDFPTHPLALHFLHHTSYICCCDGAGHTFIECGGNPNAIVGDGDSLSESFKKQYKSIVHIVKEQDDNDLTKATRHCIKLGFKKILYLGATGKREDHTMGNIALMMRYYKDFGIEPMLLTNYGWFVPTQKHTCFEVEEAQQVSIFNDNCTQISSKNLKWNAYPYTQMWQGTLNKTTHQHIEMQGNGFYMLYFAWK